MKQAGVLFFALLIRAAKESQYLRAGAGVVRGKSGSACASRDALLIRPQNGLIIAVIFGNIGKRITAGRRGATRRLPHILDDFAARRVVVRLEVARQPVHHALVHRPMHSVGIPHIRRNVRQLWLIAQQLGAGNRRNIIVKYRFSSTDNKPWAFW